MKKSKRHVLISNINVTPFVDVMLVLLVIFMSVIPVVESLLPVSLPSAKSSSVHSLENKKIFVVTIDAQQEIYFGKNKVDWSELKKILSESPEVPVYLRAHKELNYGRVVAFLDNLRSSGAEHVFLVSQRKAD